ncbi:MBL fold metallo-hydrolase [Chondromyces crocatus]|uniref:MBL fold metallo-hydrolase n=1 Tax=Chondromyces crocatus TaxID=52 RepID=A0A0K1ETA4_CHOCO|nr:MBL fold metallo-hydrolase [Chondromyces crocatus]AKT44034.1 MBL fold metallo-hydrolase [Chondromyces crocatus]
MMQIKFWGVRGSIASPGPETAGVGGNTSCVEVRCGSTRFILDAGTGIRKLGDELLTEGTVRATLLLSHLHWDHIQGLPFFVPAYLPSARIEVVGTTHGVGTLRDTLANQMAAPNFPVRLEDLGAEIAYREVRPGQVFDIDDVKVRVAKLNHPGGVLAYRLDHAGKSVVYATDTEHYACVDPALRSLAEGADVLIYDAQYTPEEYRGERGRSRVGWGHSTYVAGAELARAAGVGTFVLFHHDPSRNDAAVDDIERMTRQLFPSSLAAKEGLVLGLDAVSEAA